MPGMCHAVVAVAAMLVMGGGSMTAMVGEVATTAAEDPDNGQGGRQEAKMGRAGGGCSV
jgi:hypothetical protein